jgi:toxin CcdB
MKQFDLYNNTDKDTNKAYPYFVDVQSNLIDKLNSRVVIPLTLQIKSDKGFPEGLCPVIDIDGERAVLLTHQMTSVSTSFLKKRSGTLAPNRNEIIAAIDFLVTGI